MPMFRSCILYCCISLLKHAFIFWQSTEPEKTCEPIPTKGNTETYSGLAEKLFMQRPSLTQNPVSGLTPVPTTQ